MLSYIYEKEKGMKNMTEILGLEKLNATLNAFAEKFDCTVAPDTDFFCYLGQNKVTYALVVAEKNTNAFMRRVRHLYPDVKADVFLWSFLHEIGHIETCDDLDDDEWKNVIAIKERELTHEEYFELPDEYAATEWAANYMRQHEKEIAQFWCSVQQNIMDIYLQNGLVLE